MSGRRNTRFIRGNSATSTLSQNEGSATGSIFLPPGDDCCTAVRFCYYSDALRRGLCLSEMDLMISLPRPVVGNGVLA